MIFPGVDEDVGAGVEDKQEVGEDTHVDRPEISNFQIPENNSHSYQCDCPIDRSLFAPNWKT